MSASFRGGFAIHAALVLAATTIPYAVISVIQTESSGAYYAFLVSHFGLVALFLAPLRRPAGRRGWLPLLTMTALTVVAAQAAQLVATVVAAFAFLGIPGSNIPTLGDPTPLAFLIVFWLCFSAVTVGLFWVIWRLAGRRFREAEVK